MGESMATMEKKMAAALAAVSAYMQQEQEAYAEALAAAMAPPAPPKIELQPLGTERAPEHDAMRNLMQLKAFDRFR
jgi:hypothetical protein